MSRQNQPSRQSIHDAATQSIVNAVKAHPDKPAIPDQPVPDLETKGWVKVAIVGPDARYDAWNYSAVTKSAGGQVIIEVSPDGATEVHKGVLPRAEARRALAAANPAHDPTQASGIQTDHWQPDATFFDLVRGKEIAGAMLREVIGDGADS